MCKILTLKRTLSNNFHDFENLYNVLFRHQVTQTFYPFKMLRYVVLRCIAYGFGAEISMSERDALLLDYPTDGDELVVDVGSTSRRNKKGKQNKRHKRSDMSLNTMSLASSTDDDMVDISGPSQSTSTTSKFYCCHQ